MENFINFWDSKFGKKIMQKESEYIHNELINSEQILDVGCGIGSFEQNLPSFKIIGLDSSEEMLEEAKKRSDITFVLGNAEHLMFKDSVFDAVFTVTTIEFLDDYRLAVKEITRVTKLGGKILAMMLNHRSEYFKYEIKKADDYFRRIKHTDLKEIRDYISQLYQITNENYFLGVNGQHVFDTDDERFASLYVVVGIKR